MANAPLISTVIAVGLIPVAFFFLHAYWSGRHRKDFHRTTGLVAITWDLSMSIGYMIFRSLGGAVEGASLDMRVLILAYFIMHGTIAMIVIIMEFFILGTGIKGMKKKKIFKLHKKYSKVLFALWWFAFLTGEMFYLVVYVF